MPRQAHAAEHIDLEELPPQRVVDFKELARTVDAEVVDEDIGLGPRGDQRTAALRSANVSGHADGIVATAGLAQPGERGVHAFLRAADERNAGAGIGQPGGDGKADAASGAGDDGALA